MGGIEKAYRACEPSSGEVYCVSKGQEIARLRTALAEAKRELDEIRGVIGFPGTVALAESGLTESLADVVRYTHRQWLAQTHAANQRVIRAEHLIYRWRERTGAREERGQDVSDDLLAMAIHEFGEMPSGPSYPVYVELLRIQRARAAGKGEG